MSNIKNLGKDRPDTFDISPIDEPPPRSVGSTTGSVTSNSEFTKWTGKNFVVYIVQLIILAIVIGVALLNLTLGWHKENKDMWVAMLSSCIGYMLPALTYKRKM